MSLAEEFCCVRRVRDSFPSIFSERLGTNAICSREVEAPEEISPNQGGDVIALLSPRVVRECTQPYKPIT